ncbi:hypothetical protein ACC705_34715, partial [Rhizobium ruizarguesonis]
ISRSVTWRFASVRPYDLAVASEIADKLGETGAMTKGTQAREHVFVAELAGETEKARLAARLAKEELTRLMGLWGTDMDYQVPNGLP